MGNGIYSKKILVCETIRTVNASVEYAPFQLQLLKNIDLGKKRLSQAFFKIFYCLLAVLI